LAGLSHLDATAQAELVKRGEISPADLVQAAIERIEATDAALGAVIHRRFERAREEAASSALPDGPFRGVPFLLKDLGGESAGDPCHAGMRALRDAGYRAAADSAFTARLRGAGLVILGRTNTPELGILPTSEPEAYGPTRNPWSVEHSAGGSSGGAAAAVASGMVPAAHASDGGGSIRIPAALCGLVGLKPTRGRCSFGPGAGERWGGFSAEGVVTRSVRDTAALLDVVRGAEPGDPYTAPPPERPYAEEVGRDPGRLRIGLMRRGPRELPLHADCLAAADRAARWLEEAGHHVEEAHPDALDDPATVAAWVDVVSAGVARALDSWGGRIGRTLGAEDVEPLTWVVAERGRALPATAYLAAVESAHALGRRLAAWWEGGFDLLLTPTTAAAPHRIGDLAQDPAQPLAPMLKAAPYGAFTSAFNQSGQPAVSLPVHQGADGLPYGAQLVAASGREDLLIRVAARLEEAVDWRSRRAPVHA